MKTIRSLGVAAAAAVTLAVAGCSSSGGGGALTGSGGLGTRPASGTPSGSAPSNSAPTGASGGSSVVTASAMDSNQLKASLEPAAQAASSVHVQGTLSSGGTPIGLNLTLARGVGGQGTIMESGTTIGVLSVNGQTYAQFSAAYLEQHGVPAAKAAQYDGKYAIAPSDLAGQLDSLIDYKSFITSLFKPDATPKHYTLSGQTTVGGQQCERYVANTEEADVTLSSPQYLVRLAKSGTADGGTVTLTNWNQQVTINPPPSGEVYNPEIFNSTGGGA